MLTPFKESGIFKFYTSEIITGRTSEHALDIDSTTNFDVATMSKLDKSSGLIGDSGTWPIPQGLYYNFNLINFKDGNLFRTKAQGNTDSPKICNGARVSLYLVPECSAYVGGYSAIAVEIFIDVYKLLGGRSIATEKSLYWVKGCNSKLGLQLQVSALQCIGRDYTKLEADFMRSEYNKIEAIKLLHMTLASYAYVNNLLKTSDDLCSEIAALVYRDAVLPWRPSAQANNIDSIKDWLKESLIL